MPVPSFSVGEVLTSSAMNQVGLWLIKTDSITSGSSKEITGVFSSSYKNYRIVVSNFATNNAVGLQMRMGTTDTGVYYAGGITVAYGTGTISADVGNAATTWNIRAVATSTTASAVIDLFQPFETTTTSFASQATDTRTSGGAASTAATGFIANTTSYTSFTLLVGANTFTSCDIAVYGYRN